MRKRVLFLCTHNSARSQMAEGIVRWLTDGKIDVHSAGTEKTHVRQAAIDVMRELGVDISSQYSKTLDRYISDRFDVVITVCDDANEACPYFPHAQKRWHWSIDDPAAVTSSEETRLDAFRTARDELRRRIEEILLPTL